MGFDGFEDEWAAGDDADDHQASSPCRKRALGNSPKASKLGIKKKEKKPPAIAKTCFVAGCMLPIKAKARLCPHHFNTDACLFAQAKKSGNLDVHKDIMTDPHKAADACNSFDSENPAGTHRKALVEWGQWRKRYGVKNSVVQRQGEELMTEAEYIGTRAVKGVSKEDAQASWQSMLDSGHD